MHNNKHIDFFIESFEKIILYNFILNAQYLSKVSDNINYFVIENNINFENIYHNKIRKKIFTLLKHITMCNCKSIDIAYLFTYIDDYIADHIKNSMKIKLLMMVQ